jgi:hypothetical protein
VSKRLKSKHIFINCPFDSAYRPILDALVFASMCLGLEVRSALEQEDAAEVRLDKIQRMIEECRFGIHDISRVELDGTINLPRFNMPLELGLFLGCKRFGEGTQKNKRCLILDSEKHRYQKFISDIAGQDIRAHDNKPEQAIGEVRDWYQGALKSKDHLPGRAAIVDRYNQFKLDLPDLCANSALDPDKLTFIDFTKIVKEWLLTTG